MEDTLVYEENAYEWRPSKSVAALDQIVLLLLVLCPILQHYQGVALEVSSEVMLLLSPYILIKLLQKRKLVYRTVLPLIVYAVYVSFIHGLSVFTFGREMLLVLYYIAMINGCVDAHKYFRCAKAVALCASFCIMAQYVSYYVFGRHLQLVPTDLLKTTAEQWVLLAQTGLISVSGARMAFYRPSAFFLEPSHMALYCIPVICILLLRRDIGRREFLEAVTVSLGVVLSTSGMGIFLTGGLWGLYLLLYYGIHRGQRRKWRKINRDILLYIFALLAAAAVLFLSVGFFRSAITRVFVVGGSKQNAIGARTDTGIRLLQRISGLGILIGEGTSQDISQWNISGIFYVTYQYGLIGCLLLHLYYLKSLVRVRNGYFWLAVIALFLSPFTVHTFAAFYRMYYVCCVMGGYLIETAAGGPGDPGQRKPGQDPLIHRKI